MIEPGTKIKIPAGIQFFTIGKQGMISDYTPLKSAKTVTYIDHNDIEMTVNSGYIVIDDLVNAGAIRRDGNGELFVNEKVTKQKRAVVPQI
ncbi:MAG TPA: hypothetical protein VMW95_04525 [Desulfobacterales bacterium]|nr:hypothetical protein [Desulfobacterales bacterium]